MMRIKVYFPLFITDDIVYKEILFLKMILENAYT